jgi:large subunit ribosomal protein L25
VLPRQIHLHAPTERVLTVTFIRAPSHALLKVEVPLVFIGEDVSPGLKKGAYLNVMKRTVKYLCPADVIPPYIEVDLSNMDVGQKLLMGDLKVHPALKLVQSKDLPVCKLAGSRGYEPPNKKGSEKEEEQAKKKGPEKPEEAPKKKGAEEQPKKK